MQKRFIVSVIISVIMICSSVYASDGAVYKNVIEKEVEITAEKLNIRTGPGLSYQTVGSVEKGEKLPVIGTLNNWYIVVLKDNSIGVISNQYVKITKIDEVIHAQGGGEEPIENENIAKTDAEQLFFLVNSSRIENDLPPFIWDDKLNRIAELKAEDMVNNNYFSHNSPDYGTPFAMLKDMNVLYKSASENIARNNSMENAHLEIMNSIYHRVNVLSNRYNKMGVGVKESESTGKIIVQLFIEE